jgi:hypothetical protein
MACYGMNDGIYLPLDEERFRKFREGIEWLHEHVTKAGAAIIHVTPPTFDEVKGGHAGYSAVLGAYSDWLLRKRKAGWNVADLHGPMDTYLKERRKNDPAFAFSRDGIHPDDLGHWIMAKQILLHLGARDIVNCADGKEMLTGYPHGEEIFMLVKRRQEIVKDAWLSATGHKRPGMSKGLPLPEAQAKAASIEKEIRTMLQGGG